MKFLTLTALLAVAKADDTCTSGDADCECDTTDDSKCLTVGAACTVGEHSACVDDKIVASAVVGACANGDADCECDGDNCLTVGTACADGDHAQCVDDVIVASEDEPEVGDDCEKGADNCECDENDENCKIVAAETTPEDGDACEEGDDNCVCTCDGEECDEEDEDDKECKIVLPEEAGGSTGLIVVLVLAAVGGLAGAFYCKQNKKACFADKADQEGGYKETLI